MACEVHPDVAETHGCTHCEKRWCSACVIPLRTGHRASCPACGHLVVRASPVLSSGSKLGDAARRVWSMEGLTTALGFAFAFMGSRYVFVLGVFYVAAVVGYYFTIIRHVGDGQDGLPGPSDAVDSWTETVGVFVQGALCVAVGLVPLWLWFVVAHDFPSAGTTIALIVVGQLYMPAALLATALSNRALAVAWPPMWIAIVARAPRRYVEFAGLWLVSMIAGAIVYGATSWIVDGALSLGGTETPLRWWGFGALLAAFIWDLFLFGQAALVGIYLRENKSAFGWDNELS